MKLLSTAFLLLFVLSFTYINAQKTFNTYDTLETIEIKAVRASNKMPIAQTTIYKTDINKNNLGKDLPFLLQNTPSVVVFSDAGNGVGYTGLRIRGTDASRINFTINGVPFNDPESQGVFLVNIPDIITSAGSIQIQRGVGSSSNGTGSFGGSINLSTNEVKETKNFSFESNLGSFNTKRNTLSFNSGLMKKKLMFDGRLSNISSNGYIDRASSKLQSFYTSLTLKGKKDLIRLNIFGGKEKTYQAWYGVPQALIRTNRTFNEAGTEKPMSPYENEVDNYQQYHFHLVYNKTFLNDWKLSHTLFLTKGFGYYEQYKADQKLLKYKINDITKSDLIRQLWLNNTLLGNTFSMQKNKNNISENIKSSETILGGSINKYQGQHYGKVIKVINNINASIPSKYYDLQAIKNEQNFYWKQIYSFINKTNFFFDLQYRLVQYKIDGFRNSPIVNQNNKYSFFNPKIGFSIEKKYHKTSFYFGIGNKEPNRDDFETGVLNTPKAEQLLDFEITQSYNKNKLELEANAYFMFYNNQLVLNGKINDVGAYTRVNVKNSYRIGLEFNTSYKINQQFSIKANETISTNKIKNYKWVIDDYDNNLQIEQTKKLTSISFSPSLQSNLIIQYQNKNNLIVDLSTQIIGKQFLDNTSNSLAILKSFLVQNMSIFYPIKLYKYKIELKTQLNNVFNTKYEPNGYAYSPSINGGEISTTQYFYPAAGFNVIFGVKIHF